jgi:hypothetical protein
MKNKQKKKSSEYFFSVYINYDASYYPKDLNTWHNSYKEQQIPFFKKILRISLGVNYWTIWNFESISRIGVQTSKRQSDLLGLVKLIVLLWQILLQIKERLLLWLCYQLQVCFHWPLTSSIYMMNYGKQNNLALSLIKFNLRIQHVLEKAKLSFRSFSLLFWWMICPFAIAGRKHPYLRQKVSVFFVVVVRL